MIPFYFKISLPPPSCRQTATALVSGIPSPIVALQNYLLPSLSIFCNCCQSTVRPSASQGNKSTSLSVIVTSVASSIMDLNLSRLGRPKRTYQTLAFCNFLSNFLAASLRNLLLLDDWELLRSTDSGEDCVLDRSCIFL